MNRSILILALVLAAVSGVGPARADQTSEAKVTPPSDAASSDAHPYTQLFTVQAGAFRPAQVSTVNSSYRYDYQGASLNTYQIQPGWSLKLFHLLGAVYIEENMFVSSLKASLPGSSDTLSMFMLGVDSRIKHSWEWFPVRAIIPFVEGGYQETFYSQSGSSDFEASQGSVGNIVAAAGVDLWVNAMFGSSADNVRRYDAIPVFLTAKVNRILTNSGADVNLGSTSFLAGLSIGI